MKLSGGKGLYKNHGLDNHSPRHAVVKAPLDAIELYKKRKFLLTNIKAVSAFSAALEGWSGTTWPLQLRQSGSTPGPFAIISRYELNGGDFYGR